MTLNRLAANKSFGGWQQQFSHASQVLKCTMRFSIYLPDPQLFPAPPVLYWLSGLTCTDENFSQKAGAQGIAAKLGLAIVIPDTSPRGESIPDDEAYDLGCGAGFYVNATEQPWASHYQMYDYIVQELPELIEANFAVSSKKSISGHSMGGHGALVIGLRNPENYQSISAFSPICHPSDCPWGQKAFSAYLGDNREAWHDYDASKLLEKVALPQPILIDQGLDDQFLATQLQPENLARIAKNNTGFFELSYHEGYDHSYFFIASFIEKHLRFHASHLV